MQSAFTPPPAPHNRSWYNVLDTGGLKYPLRLLRESREGA
jgi:hypothetical protein